MSKNPINWKYNGELPKEISGAILQYDTMLDMDELNQKRKTNMWNSKEVASPTPVDNRHKKIANDFAVEMIQTFDPIERNEILDVIKEVFYMELERELERNASRVRTLSEILNRYKK